MAYPPHATGTNATDADLRHEYACHAATIASLRIRLKEIERACGGGPPAGFCEVCGAVLFPADQPVVTDGDIVTCGREGGRRDPSAPCFYRPKRADGS